MATTLTTLYPPQVETFMPSFCYNTPAKVWFNISSYDKSKINQIKYIHISMVDQRNNQNVFAGIDNSNNVVVYPQYYPIDFNSNQDDNNNDNNQMGYDPDKGMYWLKIPPQVLRTYYIDNSNNNSIKRRCYNIGQYYKVQLRFDLTEDLGSGTHKGPTRYFYWDGSSINAIANSLQLALYTNENENNFSEWSTGILLKPILIPKLTNMIVPTQTNPSTDIQISGTLIFDRANEDKETQIGDETEQLSWYQVQALIGTKNKIYYDSMKIYPTASNQINCRVDLSKFKANTNNYIRLIYETTNGYTETIDYPIIISNYSGNIEIIDSILNKDEENGIITLNITGLTNLSGKLIIRRASHYSNFTNWDLIATHDDISSLNELQIIDKTIESMTGYKYRIQYISSDEVYYTPIDIEDNNNNIINHCDFYGALFSDENNKMLRIMFDFNISNVTNATNRTKTDTLGGQYPIFTQNSKLKYHTYNISGRISSEDNGEFFLPREEIFGNEYYNYRYNINEAVDTSIFNGITGSSTPVERSFEVVAITGYAWVAEIK